MTVSAAVAKHPLQSCKQQLPSASDRQLCRQPATYVLLYLCQQQLIRHLLLMLAATLTSQGPTSGWP
jgi:hypothetical protein